jgi:glycerol-3-phosphate dehydrogenase (NAD+)
MIGDGITDLEAVQETGGADLFIGYGGVVERSYVKEHADWWVTHHDELTDTLPRFKAAMVGSGAWACAAIQMVSYNAKRKSLFEDRVDMWVYEEEYEGGKLTDKMNELKENPKYLPGVKYGENVVANPSLEDTVKDADLIIFCTPHQFVHSICKQIQLIIKPTAFAITLIKGMHLSSDGPQLISAMIRRMMKIECSVLMGANIASEVKPGSLCEATIGAHFPEQGVFFKELFDTPFFNVNVINDVEGVELAGTLKNIVAVAAGFTDGCKLGQNAKATTLREGLAEMRLFAIVMFPTVRDETFFESCGVADLIATCYGGRNHMVAIEFAKCGGKTTFEELERDLLNGQKLQGVLTSAEVQTVLEKNGWEKQYPLFTAVNAIVQGLFEPKDIVRYREIAASPAMKGRLIGRMRRSSLLEDKMGL